MCFNAPFCLTRRAVSRFLASLLESLMSDITGRSDTGRRTATCLRPSLVTLGLQLHTRRALIRPRASPKGASIARNPSAEHPSRTSERLRSRRKARIMLEALTAQVFYY
jgi:hypothetical protein